MRRKTAWLILSCLIVAVLVLASCSSDTDTDTTTDTSTSDATVEDTSTSDATVEDTGPEMVTDATGRLVEKPRYGGTISYVHTGATWDPYSRDSLLGSGDVIFQSLLVADPFKGPSGTREYREGAYSPLYMKSAGLAESWEMHDALTMTFKLRQGIRWGDSPLLNERELVADDVVYSIGKVQDHPRSYMYREPDTPRITATALDKYTVRVELPEPDPRGWFRFVVTVVVSPPEIEEAGLNWADWRTSVATGTGPYILDEVVEGSSTFYSRMMSGPLRVRSQ